MAFDACLAAGGTPDECARADAAIEACIDAGGFREDCEQPFTRDTEGEERADAPATPAGGPAADGGWTYSGVGTSSDSNTANFGQNRVRLR